MHVGRWAERERRIKFPQGLAGAAARAIGHAEFHMQLECACIRRTSDLGGDASLECLDVAIPFNKCRLHLIGGVAEGIRARGFYLASCLGQRAN